MSIERFKKLPEHIGIIPDGNRRWACDNGYEKQDGYMYGIDPGVEAYNICIELGIKEITFYGFTQDNTKRPAVQTLAFQKACVDSVLRLTEKDADLLVVGNTDSPMFPKELLPFTKRTKFGKGLIRVNVLVNYGWNWDINHSYSNKNSGKKYGRIKGIASSNISRIDLIIRWGGRRRLSGFLPIQSIYADFYVLDEMWPDFKPEHIYKSLDWYQNQDITLGG